MFTVEVEEDLKSVKRAYSVFACAHFDLYCAREDQRVQAATALCDAYDAWVKARLALVEAILRLDPLRGEGPL